MRHGGIRTLRAVPPLPSHREKPAQDPNRVQEPAKLVLVSKREKKPLRGLPGYPSARANQTGMAYAMGVQTQRVIDQIESEITRQAIRRLESVDGADANAKRGAVVYLPSPSTQEQPGQATWQARAKQILRQLFGSPLPVDR